MDSPTSFYVTGGTVPRDAASYIARHADTELLQSLLAGEFCYVLNTRQMGKSSLSVRTLAALQERGVKTVFLDLTRLGGQNVTVEQWYLGLLVETGRALGLRSEFLAYWKAHAEFSFVQRFFGALGEVALEKLTEPIVVFVDELDAALSLTFLVDEFFGALREGFNRRTQDPRFSRLTFCLLGVATKLNGVAWKLVDPAKAHPTPEVARQAREVAELAVQLTEGKDGLILDTLAATQFACGDLDSALATQRKAVKVLPNDKDLAANLARYEKLWADRSKGQK